MMHIKHIIVRTLLVAEMVAFTHLYLFGKNGLQVLQVQKKQLQNLQQTIVQLQKEVNDVESEMIAWETDDFYKEKYAREKLQMARKGDKLFLY